VFSVRVNLRQRESSPRVSVTSSKLFLRSEEAYMNLEVRP